MNFDTQQQAVIDSESTILTCLAGPGAGKSSVLIARVRKLIERGCHPENIVCITFTNAAAEELNERLQLTLGYNGTLHGWLLRLIRRNWLEAGFGSDKIAVMDDRQSDEMLSEVVAMMRLKVSHEKLAKAMRAGEALKGDASAAVMEYQLRSRRNGLIDFNTVLSTGLSLLETVAMPRLDALLCDEIQDAAPIDLRIYQSIPAVRKFYVGDFSQSIYGFRGTDVQAVASHVAAGDWLEMRTNYRSDIDIVASSERLRKRIPSGVCGTAAAVANSTERGSVEIHTTFSEPDAQAGEIVRLIKERQRLYEFEETAVLVRTNPLARHFADILRANGLPVRERLPANVPPDWSRCRLLVNLLVDPENDLLAYWWLEETQGKAKADSVRRQAMEALTTINQAVMHVPEVELDALPVVLVRGGIGPESVAKVVKAMAGANNLSELSIKLGDAELWRESVGEGVSVLTIHSAKGKEWDSVYLPCLNNGVLPMKSDDVNEARRLLYVAMTRARHTLDIFAGTTVFDWRGKPEAAEPSMFINEIQQ